MDITKKDILNCISNCKTEENISMSHL